MQPFFSIVIPTLNEEKFLPILLSDLQKQKVKNFEVIIADGKSEDKTKEEALKFREKLSLKFFENERKNVAYQRNYGAKQGLGHYLVFLDADARVTPFFTKTLQKTIEQKKGLVFLPANIPSDKSPQTQLVFRFVNFLVELSQSTGKPFSTMGMIFQRNFFYTISGFDENVYIAEDHKIIQEAHRWGVKAKFAKKVRVTFSLRRMKSEGQWTLLYKYLLATAYILVKGDIKNKIFAYDMGGKDLAKAKKNAPIFSDLQSYIKQLKDFFENA